MELSISGGAITSPAGGTGGGFAELTVTEGETGTVEATVFPSPCGGGSVTSELGKDGGAEVSSAGGTGGAIEAATVGGSGTEDDAEAGVVAEGSLATGGLDGLTVDALSAEADGTTAATSDRSPWSGGRLSIGFKVCGAGSRLSILAVMVPAGDSGSVASTTSGAAWAASEAACGAAGAEASAAGASVVATGAAGCRCEFRRTKASCFSFSPES